MKRGSEGEPDSRSPPLLKGFIPALLTLVFGASLSLYGFMAWRAVDQAESRLEFHEMASQRLDEIRRDMQKSINAVGYVATLLEAAGPLDRKAFEYFAGAVMKNSPAVEQLLWAPAAAPPGARLTARYTMPLQDRPALLGRPPADEAGQIEMIDSLDHFRFRLMLPVHPLGGTATAGYVAGTIALLDTKPAAPGGTMLITVSDPSAPPGQQILYPPGSQPGGTDSVSHSAQFGPRNWVLTASRAAPPQAGTSWQGPVILAGGIAASAALALYLLLLLRRRSQNEALVRRRTQEADEALAQLKRSDERFRDYVTTASDWYWEAGPDLFFTMVADRADKFGIDRNALLGLARLTEAEDPARADRRLDVLRKRVAFQDLRYEYPREDGALSLSLNGLPVFDEKGVFQGYRGCARDITAQRRAEQAQTDALWAAEQNNRAKSAFLANMSHEIRTPMNGVLGMVQVLRTTALDADQRRMVEVIYQSATGLLTILNDILDYSKLEAGKVQMESIGCSLTDMMEGVTMLLRHVADAKGVGLICHLPPEKPPPVLADPTRLRQVLLNLVSNAIKFSYEGAVTLRLQTEPAEGNRLHITMAVTDQGIGISEEAQKSLFGRFNQADASATRLFGGTGLGLAITRELIALMGGDVSVKSTLGIGSTFTVAVTLPIAAEDDIPVETGSPKALTGPVKQLNLLVAEDDEINWLVIRSFLEAQGHTATLVTNGEEAVAAVQAAHYDLVLMDSMMPVMDGVTATRRIRQLHLEHGPVPIIALTANAMVGDREKYMKAGMDGYVSKPIDRTLLFEAMEKVLGVRVAKPAEPPPPAPDPKAQAADDDIEAFMASLDP